MEFKSCPPLIICALLRDEMFLDILVCRKKKLPSILFKYRYQVCMQSFNVLTFSYYHFLIWIFPYFQNGWIKGILNELQRFLNIHWKFLRLTTLPYNLFVINFKPYASIKINMVPIPLSFRKFIISVNVEMIFYLKLFFLTLLLLKLGYSQCKLTVYTLKRNNCSREKLNQPVQRNTICYSSHNIAPSVWRFKMYQFVLYPERSTILLRYFSERYLFWHLIQLFISHLQFIQPLYATVQTVSFSNIKFL